MADRRSFLKGLSAAFLVPSPTLWTPEERQLVASTDFPPPPVPSNDLPKAGDPVDWKAPPSGYLMMVMPEIDHQSWTHTGKWTAFHARPHRFEIERKIDWHETSTFCSYERVPTVTETDVKASLHNAVWHIGDTPGAAARAATTEYTNIFNPDPVAR